MTSLNRRIFKDSFCVTLLNFCAQALGYILTMLVAKEFGANWITDSYYLAFVIPGLLIGVVGGIVKIVFIPVFVEERIKNPENVSEIIGSTVAAILIASGVSVIVVALFSYSNILSLGQKTEAKALTQVLLIELLPLIPLTMLSGIFAAVYNSYQRFILPGVMSITRFIVIIITLILFVKPLGIHSLVLGHVGAQLLILLVIGWAICRKLRLDITPRLKYGNAFRRMFRMSFLPFLSYLFTQMNTMISRVIASFLAEGAISVISYAQKLAVIPSLAIGTGFMGVVLSHWSKSVAQEDEKQLQNSLNRSVSMILTILVPFVIGLYILRVPLIRLLLQRGAFGEEAVAITAKVFSILVIAVIPTYLHMLICRVLVAKKDLLTLFWTSSLPVVIHPILCYFLAIVFQKGPFGVALSTFITSSLVLFLTAFMVHINHVRFSLRLLGRNFLQVMTASFIMVCIILIFENIAQVSITRFGLFFEICSIGLIGSIVYIGFLRLIHHSDIVDVLKMI